MIMWESKREMERKARELMYKADDFTFGSNTEVYRGGEPVRNGGQGEIRTRDFCLAKAAIYRADLLAH